LLLYRACDFLTSPNRLVLATEEENSIKLNAPPLLMLLVLAVIFVQPIAAVPYAPNQTINHGGTLSSEKMGNSVSMYDTLMAMGAANHRTSSSCSNVGRVYIFEYSASSGNWSDVTTLSASDASCSQRFGADLSMSATHLAISSISSSAPAQSEGIYVFSTSSWTQIAKITTPSGSSLTDLFGFSVTTFGAYVIAGAHLGDDRGLSSGGAYVFKWDSGNSNYAQTQSLYPTDAVNAYVGDQFGYSVSMHDQYLAISSPKDSPSGYETGSVYMFLFNGTHWDQDAKVQASDGAGGDNFGACVSVSTLTAPMVLVGANYADHSGSSDLGAAYVFKRVSGSWSQKAKLTPSEAGDSSYFGASVDLFASIAVIGARSSDGTNGGNAEGSAYYFQDEGLDDWQQKRQFKLSNPSNYDYFGTGVVVYETKIVVTADSVDTPSTANIGAGYYFTGYEVCGNGLIRDPESCDDGNYEDLDGCSGGCSPEQGWSCFLEPSTCQICGNGLVEFGEECDDGNGISGDGCSSVCVEEGLPWVCWGIQPTICENCGNGLVEGNETCDNNNTLNGDGCNSVCRIEANWTCNTNAQLFSECQSCGNGLVEYTEVCDDGVVDDLHGCHGNCSIVYGWSCQGTNPSVCQQCANNLLEGTEECEDGNLVSGDGCSSDCKIETGYTCWGPESNICEKCGNLRVEGNETCDDGNLNPADGCSSGCRVETGWACNSLTTTNGTVNLNTTRTVDGITFGTVSVCQKPGNGIVEGVEECDDKNTVSLDGCNATMEIEEGFTCAALGASEGPSTCQKCGNARVEGTEACDDGNLVNGEGCTSSCAIQTDWTCSSIVWKELHGWKLQVDIADNVINENNIQYKTMSVCQSPGNSKTEGFEECDDGNLINGDGCAANSIIEAGYTCYDGFPSRCHKCGNGMLDPFEECDDGNLNDWDGCDSTCKKEFSWLCSNGDASNPDECSQCGDGVKEYTERCDDANLNDGDGCSSLCKVESGWKCNITVSPSACRKKGNGIIEPGEECDDANLVNGDGCNDEMELEYGGYYCPQNSDRLTVCSFCGDGVVSGFEVCDDGNLWSGDGCSSDCLSVETDWVCNQPVAVSICQKLGNGVVEGTEECDDGNLLDGDGCARNSTIERDYICTNNTNPTICMRCGANFIEGYEECDDGNIWDGDGCSQDCKIESGWTCERGSNATLSYCYRCGNGIIEENEQCDDENTADGDGCSSTCKIEPTYTCLSQPSDCIPPWIFPEESTHYVPWFSSPVLS
jgi:cysteine-rich repeat protein